MKKITQVEEKVKNKIKIKGMSKPTIKLPSMNFYLLKSSEPP